MIDIVAFFLEIYLDIKHWIKVKKRRKFEEKNNLPKRIMLHPLNKVSLVVFIIAIPFIILKLNHLKKQSLRTTHHKIDEIKLLLEAEKKQLGFYPKELKDIIRNNPLRKNLTLDGWKNEFVYIISKDSLNYTLISFGKDKVYNTSDDIKLTN